MTSHHKKLLDIIRKKSQKPSLHPFLNHYLGNNHPLYTISTPELRSIAKTWMQEHRDLSAAEFLDLMASLIGGKTFTEKCLPGILMGYATKEQRRIDPGHFDQWLNHLAGWAEVDSLCTGKHLGVDIPDRWPAWKKLIVKLSQSANINKRRASLVLLCSPLRQIEDERLAETAFKNVERLKGENDVLITKAISWVLRSMVPLYPSQVKAYINDNMDTLPKIAIRETMTKLTTGRKTKRK
jgi:3-methyladenine DNA glycosylase AlkD